MMKILSALAVLLLIAGMVQADAASTPGKGNTIQAASQACPQTSPQNTLNAAGTAASSRTNPTLKAASTPSKVMAAPMKAAPAPSKVMVVPLKAVKKNAPMKVVKPRFRNLELKNSVLNSRLKRIQEVKKNIIQDTGNFTDSSRQFRRQGIMMERAKALNELGGFLADRNTGMQVSSIGLAIGNSINLTMAAEKRINERDSVSRLLFGGDHDSADAIAAEVSQNKARLYRLRKMNAAAGGLGPFFKAQLMALELEQNRLENISKTEKQSKGMFGWIYK
ncbi:MAG: hypothetical protein ABIH11_08790 [Candidatus Altiarchaeota archaeon]